MSGEGILAANANPQPRKRLPPVICPICSAHASIHRHERTTPLVSALWAHCGNTECGHTFRMSLEFVHTISPSAIPNDLHLPQAPQRAPPVGTEEGAAQAA